MRTFRVGVCALCVTTGWWLAACSAEEPLPEAPTNTGSSSAPVSSAPGSSASAGASPTGPPTGAPTPAATPTPSPTDSRQPVPKVERSGSPSATVSAPPADVDETVRYRDGVSLRVVGVEFAKETKEGPGSFPGREYAVLRLQIGNKSTRSLSMATVVVTVLDKADQPVAPVYTEEAEVSDFAGTLRPGETVSARYAFAVPRSSRSKVTVVVDFDGAHSSAVFRGALR